MQKLIDIARSPAQSNVSLRFVWSFFRHAIEDEGDLPSVGETVFAPKPASTSDPSPLEQTPPCIRTQSMA